MTVTKDADTGYLSTGTPEDASGSRAPTLRVLTGRVALVGAVLVTVFVALAGFAGYQLGRAGDAPREGGADVGFARDMQAHHNQAVQMALIIRDKTADPTLRAVAYDIATSQSQQAGQMYGWLAHWGLPATSPDRPMAWMTAEHHQPEDGPSQDPTSGSDRPSGTTSTPEPSATHAGMPGMRDSASSSTPNETAAGAMGMATPAQLQSLQQATGVEAERQFLTMMIAHHRVGVQMAQAALRLATEPEVLTLARAIDTAQTAEIKQLQQLLEARR